MATQKVITSVKKPAGARKWWWSVDPGQAHVGVAMWSGTDLVGYQEMTPQSFLGTLYRARPDLVVVEAFTLAGPRYSREKSKQAVDTIKLIGAIQGVAVALGFENDSFNIVEQQPSVRNVAQRSPFWTALMKKETLTGNSHVRSAVAHGVYFARFTDRGRRYVG